VVESWTFLNLVVFLGSARTGRNGSRVATFVVNELKKRGHSVFLFDPLEAKLPILEKAYHHYPAGTAPQNLTDMATIIRNADGYVVISAEYNHSMPPALINLMDHFPCSGYSYKPSGIVCYSPGQYGGVRASMQLRAFLGELGCLSVSNIFAIPEVHKAIAENGTPSDPSLIKRFERLLVQLEWMGSAMKNHRNKVGVPN